MANKDIVSIDYELSIDNANWSHVDETIIDYYDYGLNLLDGTTHGSVMYI